MLKRQGYKTSSKNIKYIINTEGLDSFRIIKVLTEFECGVPVYEYESNFLKTNNIAINDNWVNKTNNNYFVEETKERKQIGKIYNNKIDKQHRFDKKDIIPSGWVLGKLNPTTPYSNGIEIKYFVKNSIIPEGYTPGKQLEIKYFNNGIDVYGFNKNEIVPDGWLPGLLPNTSPTKNKTYFNNGIEEKRMFTSDVPEDWVIGRLQKYKGLKMITNGIDIKMLSGSTIPAGWVIGGKSSEYIGATYYSNGTEEKRFKDKDDIPFGWYKGRKKTKRTSASPIGMVWITDGIIKMKILKTETIPYGFVYGKGKNINNKSRKWYTNGIDNKMLPISEDIPDGYYLGLTKNN